jgi:hypothetical protein
MEGIILITAAANAGGLPMSGGKIWMIMNEKKSGLEVSPLILVFTGGGDQI